VIKQILKIRVKQTYRSIADIGLFRIIFVLILTFFFLALMFNQFQKQINGMVAIILLVAFILFIHLQRKDKIFIKIINDKAHYINLAEYLIFSSPIILLAIIANRLDLVLYQIIGISIIPFTNATVKVSKQNLNNKILKVIPNHCFEIKSGLRKNFYFIVPLNILALFFGFWIGTAPIILIINTLVFSSFYQLSEPRNIIEINQLSPNRFIINKFKTNLFIFIAIQIPIIFLFLLFNYQHYIIVTSIFIISILFIVFSILLKYALYKPNSDLRANSVIQSIAILMIPVLIFMIPFYYFKAKNNLIPYLNDYN